MNADKRRPGTVGWMEAVLFPPESTAIRIGGLRFAPYTLLFFHRRLSAFIGGYICCQTATTSISGSIDFTRFSMPASVPEIELGQLPHAPW